MTHNLSQMLRKSLSRAYKIWFAVNNYVKIKITHFNMKKKKLGG